MEKSDARLDRLRRREKADLEKIDLVKVVEKVQEIKMEKLDSANNNMEKMDTLDNNMQSVEANESMSMKSDIKNIEDTVSTQNANISKLMSMMENMQNMQIEYQNTHNNNLKADTLSSMDSSMNSNLMYHTPAGQTPGKTTSEANENISDTSELSENVRNAEISQIDITSRSVTAAANKNIMLVSTEIVEFKDLLKGSNMSILGIYQWLDKVKAFERLHDCNIQLWRKITTEVFESFLLLEPTHYSNAQLIEHIKGYAATLADTRSAMIKFFRDREWIKTRINYKTAASDMCYLVDITQMVIMEFNRAYDYYAKLVNHIPAKSKFNLEVFPEVTSGGKQKVSEFWLEYMNQDRYLKVLITHDVTNLIKRFQKQGWEHVSIALQSHFKEQKVPLKIAKDTASKYNMNLYASRPVEQSSARTNNYTADTNKERALNNIEPEEEEIDKSSDAPKSISDAPKSISDAPKSISDEPDDSDYDDEDNIDQLQELNNLDSTPNEDKACLEHLKKGSCSRSSCNYSHKIAQVLRNQAKHSFVLDAMVKTNHLLNPDNKYYPKSK